MSEFEGIMPEPVRLDWTDPDLLAAASVPGGPDRVMDAVATVLRERGDARAGAAEELKEARCECPDGRFPPGAEYPLFSGGLGEISFSEPTGILPWRAADYVLSRMDGEDDEEGDSGDAEDGFAGGEGDDLDEDDFDVDADDLGDDEEDGGGGDGLEEDDGDGPDEDGWVAIARTPDGSWLSDPRLRRLRPDPGSAEFRSRLEAAFAEAKQHLLFDFLGVGDEVLTDWATVTGGGIEHALTVLGRWANRLWEREPVRAAGWLLHLDRRDPTRVASLMARLWAVPGLHATGYRVLDATRPGWTAVLPGLAPASHAGTVGELVRRGAGDAACAALDALSPGWQADLARALELFGRPN